MPQAVLVTLDSSTTHNVGSSIRVTVGDLTSILQDHVWQSVSWLLPLGWAGWQSQLVSPGANVLLFQDLFC